MTIRRPRIAVLLDENTTGGGTRYEASKSYFNALQSRGALPFGIPFFPNIVEDVVARFDGLLSTGGRFAYPGGFYRDGLSSSSPLSERVAVEIALMRGFLGKDKPILGICAGMQMLGCLHGARMVPDVRLLGDHVQTHDEVELHRVRIVPGTKLAAIVAADYLDVNSRHREALADIPASVRVAASADDSVIEAIEIPSRRFAIGLQWHQEAFAATDHPGNAVFAAFVAACGQP